MPTRALTLLAALAAAAWLGGCSDDSSPTGPSAALTRDDADGIAQQIAATLAVDNGGALALWQGSVPGLASGKSGGGKIAAGVEAETTFTRGGITCTLTRTFYDALGREMPAFNPLLTVRMVADSRARGTIATPRFSATLGHASTLDVTGLSALRDTLRFNGSAVDTCLSSFTSLDSLRTRHFHLQASAVLADVLCRKPMTAGNWPLSGTATWSVVADQLRSNNRLDVSAHLEAGVVVRFNGTRNVEIEVDGHWTYHADLKTGAVTRAPAWTPCLLAAGRRPCRSARAS
jgi:hypothetical protein